MIRYKITHRYIGPLIACLCLGLSASSCVDDDAGCIEDKPGYVEGNDVWLSFTVKGEDPAPRTATSRTSAEAPGSLFSRADDDPDGNKHPAEAATDAENYINPTDIRLLLFDNRDCLMKIFDNSEIVVLRDATNASSYEIKVKINRAYFDYAGTAEVFDMSFMLIANLNGFGEGSVKPFPTAASIPYMKKHTALANEYYDFTYTPGTQTAPWFPNGSTNAIPMSGLKKYTVSLAAIDGATDATKPYQLDGDNASPLLLQRAIAKIRVFDNIAEDAATKITGFRIVGLNDHGTYLPDFSSDITTDSRYDWRNGTVMVEKASVKPEWFRPGLTAYSTRLEKSDTDYIGDFKNGDDIEFDEAFVAYIPEADLTTATATDIPQLIITTKSEIDKTEANPDGIRPWTFSLKEIIKNEVIDITRNHIYEFTVTRSIDSQLTLNYTVCPWLTETVTLPPFD